jgi:hypothetical protein
VNNQREEGCTDNAQYAPDGSTNQALKADQAQPPFEQDYACTEQSSHDGVEPGSGSKRINEIAGNSNEKYKKDTYENQIHSTTSQDS